MGRNDRAVVRNAADPVQVALAERLEKDRAMAIEDCLRAVMSIPQGRRIIAEFLETAGINRTVFDHSGSVMNFNEGRRCHGIEWQGYAEDAAPEMYLLMQQEMRALREKILREVTAHRSRRAQVTSEGAIHGN